MRILICFLAYSFFLSSLSHADETPTQFMEKWVESYNKNDSAFIISCYNEADETDLLVSYGKWYRGYAAIKKMYVEDFKAIRFYDSKAEDMKSQIIGEVAIVSFIHKFKFEILQNKVRFRIHIRTTATLKKVGTSWKIVSEHSSAIHGIERAKVIEKGE